jgi:arylsulfatase A-like enzyme
VARVIDALRASGRLGNTVIAFTSDNGYLQGQHRLVHAKVVPYGDSARVPLLIRGPGFERGRSDAVVANIDLAPTFLELAGAEPMLEPDGASLVPLLRGGRADLGRDLVLENLEEGVSEKYAPYRALRTKFWLYVDYDAEEQGVELYDLRSDPDNLTNLASELRYDGARERLARRLAAMRDCAGAKCR